MISLLALGPTSYPSRISRHLDLSKASTIKDQNHLLYLIIFYKMHILSKIDSFECLFIFCSLLTFHSLSKPPEHNSLSCFSASSLICNSRTVCLYIFLYSSIHLVLYLNILCLLIPVKKILSLHLNTDLFYARVLSPHTFCQR